MAAYLDSVTLALLGSAIASVFMILSLVGFLKPAAVAVAAKTTDGAGKKDTADASALTGAHTRLLAHLENIKVETIRRDWPPLKPKTALTADLLEMSRSLQLSPTSVVTLALTADEVNEDVITILALLVQVAHVFCIIDLSVPLTNSPGGGGPSKSTPNLDSLYPLLPLPRHRIIPTQTHASRIAAIRQLSPALHIDSSRAAAKALKPHVPCVLLVSEETVLSLGVPLVRVGSWNSASSSGSRSSKDSNGQDKRGGDDEDGGIYSTDEGYLLLDSIWAVIAVNVEHYPGRLIGGGGASSSSGSIGRYRTIQLPPFK